MLVRVNSGVSGVAAYLETGRKRGREFDRDLIDERLVLDGDLALMDTVIDNIETAQEGDARYLHMTLGLTETFTSAAVCGPGEVNLEKLKAITDAYRDALMTAYGRDEYAWYAEAHIPKVSHELHESTGEYIARLPHVHIVLPMRNLEDGRYLNPFGYARSTIDFAQALQEQVNAEFGLRSPLASRRDAPHNPVAKHNAKFAPATPKEIRETALAMLRYGQAASFEQLADKLAEFGEVRVRNGKDGEYLNIKPAWAERGINLKDLGRANFVEALSEARAGAPDEKPAQQLARMAELAAHWEQKGAYEARYLSRANRVHYKKLDAGEQHAWLVDKTLATRARLEARDRDWQPGGPNADFIKTLEERNGRNHKPRPGFATARDAWRAANLYQSRAGEAARRQPTQTLSSVRKLSSVALVQHQRTIAMLLHANAPDRLGQGRKARDDVRRPGAGHIGAAGRTRKPITVAATLIAARARTGPDADRLKADTSPSIVLEAAARLYKIDLAEYGIGSGRDGTPRIQHGDKQFNLGDFFTKHLNVSWETAKPILSECYHATLSDGLPPPDRDLWKSFSAWRQQAFEDRRVAAEQARTAGRAQLLQAREEHKRVKTNARAIPARQRQAVMAAGRAQQLVAEAESKRLTQELRAASRRPSRNAEYREFLTDLANRGNLAALGELRRAAPPDRDPFDGVTGAKSKSVLPLPSYKIDHAGRVTYFKNERSIVTDSAKGVAVLRRDSAAYETAIKVAVARYGRNLTFRGDQVFLDNMIEAARRSGLELTIRDANKPRAQPIVVRGPELRR